MSACISSRIFKEIEMEMKAWTRPDFVEVNLGCEINCYAPAEI
jgi:coenzyme PQQ precursor peptide PqqA